MSSRSAAACPSNLDIYFDEVRHYRPLTRQEEAELGPAIRAKDPDAIHRLVNANLRFVVSIAKQYANYGVPLEDLINEGNMGLMEAAQRFDERRGYKFISYAVWWIRQSIMAALARQSKAVRMPISRARTLHRLRKTYARLEQDLERMPAPDELATAMGISESEVGETFPLMNDSLSLDDPVGDDEKTSFIDVLKDNDEDATEMPLLEEELMRGVREALSQLRPREADVISQYFGLDGKEQMTLDEIGERMHLTRERIRQIKEEALEKMRSRPRFRFLEDYRSMATLH